MPSIYANGLKLAVTESGNGEPLILLHGGNSDRHQYDIFRPLLGEGIRAIAYDQRDSPDSPCPDEPYSTTTHAADLAGVITGLGLDRAHIMGVSYGGAIAMTAAVLYPEIFKSLILGATASSRDQFQARDMSALRDTGPEAVERFMLEAAASPEALDKDETLVSELRGALVNREPAAFHRRMNALASHDVQSRLKDISVPTLVLHGDEDPLVPLEAARALATGIPGATFFPLEGSRHAITIQNRQRTADHVRSFVLANA